MDKALISIIVPTYNRTGYLAQTLNSIMGQTYRPIEIIVVDDGSTGDENNVLCNRYPEVRYIKIENSGGPAKPRNVGFEASTGKYVAWVDDDDLWLKDKLQQQMDVLNSEPDFDLIHGPCVVIDEHSNETGQLIGRPGSAEIKHGDVRGRIMGNWTLMMPTPLLRRSLVQSVGLFNEQIPAALEDVEFWVRCSFFSKFYYLDRPLVQYRKHAENISASKKKYVQLPLYLNEVRKQMFRLKKTDRALDKQLSQNLVRMQLKSIKEDWWRSLGNAFRINPWWPLYISNIKILIKRMIK